MSDMGVGLSALMAARYAIMVSGQNIANANTPGYSRQRVLLAAAPPQMTAVGYIGTGVTAVDVRGVRDRLLQVRLLQQESLVSAAASSQQLYVQLEEMFYSGSGHSLNESINEFFRAVNSLAAQPEDLVVRQLVLDSGVALADDVRNLSARMRVLGAGIEQQVTHKVAEANELLDRIATLNRQIAQISVRRATPNDLIDQRDEAVRQLAGLMDLEVVASTYNTVRVLHQGNTLVTESQSVRLGAGLDASDGQFRLFVNRDSTALDIVGGELGGLLGFRNRVLPAQQAQLDELASALIREVNAAHARGLGLRGPWTRWEGTNAVQDINRSGDAGDDYLSRAGLPFPVAKGQVYFNITNLATGRVEQAVVEVDPGVDTLNTIAAKIDALPHMSANIQNGRLVMMAERGYGFDCASRLDFQPPDLGMATVRLGGSYGGSNNRSVTLRAAGSGIIGSTAGLEVEVLDGDGRVLARLDVGEHYEPGTVLEIGDGVSLVLGSGMISDGDVSRFFLVADSDSAGLLPSLGLNGLFTGSDSRDIQVRSDLVSRPEMLAGSGGGGIGDNSNLLRVLEVQERGIVGESGATLNQRFEQIVSSLGIQAARARSIHENEDLLLQTIQNQRDNVSGVSVDEELALLMEHQQAFQAAARYLSTVMRLMDVIMEL